MHTYTCMCMHVYIQAARAHSKADGHTFDVILYVLPLKPTAAPVCHFFECCATHTQTHTHIARTGVTTGTPPTSTHLPSNQRGARCRACIASEGSRDMPACACTCQRRVYTDLTHEYKCTRTHTQRTFFGAFTLICQLNQENTRTKNTQDRTCAHVRTSFNTARPQLT